MMILLDVLKGGGAPRGTPRRRGSPRLVAIAMIAGLAVLQSGCQSGARCRSCNPCGLFRRTADWILHRKAPYYGGTVVGEPALEYSVPSTVVGPPTTVAPLYSTTPGTTTVPGKAPLPSDPSPTDLEPTPRANIGPEPLPQTSRSNTGPTSYHPRSSGTTTRTAARIEIRPTAERASMARPASVNDESGAADVQNPADDDNPLDHLPPLDLPGEVTQSAMATPSPTASRPSGAPAVDATTDDAGVDFGQVAVEESPNPAAGGGPGIARFAPIAPELAGGSVPAPAGLAWLVEKGYRTVLDLRDPAEVPNGFIADVAARGLRYVALPIDLTQLDPEQVSRFQFELAAREARPLYFFDTDGSRAGALWYIRRVAVDGVAAEMARREAEEVGLKAPDVWRMTTAYLERQEASKARPASSTAAAAEASDPPSPPSATEAAHQPSPTRTNTPHASSDRMANLGVPTYHPDQLIPPVPDRAKTVIVTPISNAAQRLGTGELSPGWRPFATMLITGLTLPLVYWTRGALPDAIARARASLPGAGPQPRSLPHASGD